MNSIDNFMNHFSYKICKQCGNPYCIIESNNNVETIHLNNGLACNWCSFEIYQGYFLYYKSMRAKNLGTFKEKDIFN